MNLKKTSAIVGLGLLAMAPSALAAPHTVTGGLSATDLVNLLVPVDSGITIVGTPTFFAGSNAQQYGSFNNTTPGDTGIPFNSGILLSSGNVADSVGPNNIGNRTTSYSGISSSLITTATGIGSTRDAAILEFQFTSTANVFSFAYMFASEEYNEFVNSNFNDVFAFILDGPGYSNQNLAVLPDSTVVSINNINGGEYSQYYSNNDTAAYNLQYDGMVGGGTALPLYVSAIITAGETYTISIAIADVGDTALDSGVFLQGGSFTANELPPEAVPEPATYLGALALVGLAARRFRKRA